MREVNLYFDVRKFNKQEFGLLIIENRIADLEKRVGNYQSFTVDTLGRPDFPFAETTLTDRREIDALYVMQRMVRQGFDNFLWISGPGGDHKYTDTRITWLKVANVTQDRVYFDDNKAICSEIGAERCVELANSLVKNGGAILGDPQNVEELRSYVVGFKDGQIIERLAVSLEEMESVWNGIKNGVDKTNLKEVEKIADWVEVNYGGQMRRNLSDVEAIRLGAMIETQIKQRFGVNLMTGGAHGMSNQAALQGMGGMSVFDRIYNGALVSSDKLDNRLKKCESCGVYFMKKKEKCPKCNKT